MVVSENSPRAIRGLVSGIYQTLIVFGIMLSLWSRYPLEGLLLILTMTVNYGCLLHLSSPAVYIVPIAMQGLPGVLLLGCMFFCNESPRWLARRDRWEEATHVLSIVRNLSPSHPYVQDEMQEMAHQLADERRLIGDAGLKDLMREMWFIPGNRRRALVCVGVMISQQFTGTNAM